MDENELATFQNMPDYVDMNKDVQAADESQPSESDSEGNQPATDTDESQNTEPEEGQPEDSEEEVEPSEEPAEDKYLVKINGEEKEVTLEDLKKSYMLESDYRRKTSELAEERRIIESQTQARTQELERLRTVIADAEKSLIADLQNSEARSLREAINKIDVASLTQEQLTQFMQAKAHCEQLEAREREKIAKFEAANKKYLAEQEKILNEQWAQDQRILERDIPDIKDPVKREKLNQDISGYLLSIYGEKRAQEIASTIRSKEDYKTLYYAAMGKKLLETKTPAKVMPKAKTLSVKNQSGAQSVTSTQKKSQDALLAKIKSAGARGEASDADIIQYLSMSTK
jgi:hypothetical protein